MTFRRIMIDANLRKESLAAVTKKARSIMQRLDTIGKNITLLTFK